MWYEVVTPRLRKNYNIVTRHDSFVTRKQQREPHCKHITNNALILIWKNSTYWIFVLHLWKCIRVDNDENIFVTHPWSSLVTGLVQLSNTKTSQFFLGQENTKAPKQDPVRKLTSPW